MKVDANRRAINALGVQTAARFDRVDERFDRLTSASTGWTPRSRTGFAEMRGGSTGRGGLPAHRRAARHPACVTTSGNAVDAAVAAVRLVDHHVHGALRDTPDRADARALLTESDRPVPPWMTMFDSPLGLAIRRWCAPLLDLEPRRRGRRVRRAPHRARRGRGHAAHAAPQRGRSTTSSRPATPPTSVLDPAEMAAAAQRVRGRDRPAGVGVRGARGRGRRRGGGAHVPRGAGRAHGGRGGPQERGRLPLRASTSRPSRPRPPRRWPRPGRCSRRPGRRAPGWPTRPCCATCSGRGVERGLPLQLHCGYGDPDLDLHRCDPLLLTRFLRLVEPRGVDVLLLHCYPYHRQAGYLAQVFPHVYFDVGLAVNHTGAGIGGRGRRVAGARPVRQDPLLVGRLRARRAAPPRRAPVAARAGPRAGAAGWTRARRRSPTPRGSPP